MFIIFDCGIRRVHCTLIVTVPRVIDWAVKWGNYNVFPKCVWSDNIDIVWQLFVFQYLAVPCVTVFQYFQVKMSLLAEPCQVVLPVSVPEGIPMTRVLVEQGVYLLEVQFGVG